MFLAFELNSGGSISFRVSTWLATAESASPRPLDSNPIVNRGSSCTSARSAGPKNRNRNECGEIAGAEVRSDGCG